MRNRKRGILLLAILLALGGVAYKVTEAILINVREIKKNPLKALDYLPEGALRIKDFHRSKIEEGRKVWELFGDEANYSKDKGQATIKNPKFYYYDQKGETAQTSGDVAHLFFNDKELEKMELQGAVQVAYQGYLLKSEEAIYLPAKDQIILPSRTTIVGEGLELEGSSMEVELYDKKVRMLRNVKTKIEPDKVAKKKNKTETSQANGG